MLLRFVCSLMSTLFSLVLDRCRQASARRALFDEHIVLFGFLISEALSGMLLLADLDVRIVLFGS